MPLRPPTRYDGHACDLLRLEVANAFSDAHPAPSPGPCVASLRFAHKARLVDVKTDVPVVTNAKDNLVG
eukprot:scaffold46938_cov75-Phaeocystis_antarctica.AAC.3